MTLALPAALFPASGTAQPVWPDLVLTPFVTGISAPVGIVHAGDGSGRLFVVQQTGTVRVIEEGTLLTDPFLDVTSRVSCCGEQGLLGLAFPPDYPLAAVFYVNYTDTNGDTVVARYSVDAADPDRADADSEEVLLEIAQPYANHNGGQLAFGPADGLLYVGTGDGGSGGDPLNSGQTTDTLLGKILRIDVSAGAGPYAIPPSNPLVGVPGSRQEIWALGLRNPWRFSFDRLTGDLYIGDVGQGAWEEIDFQPAASPGGENYGWRIMEASQCYPPGTTCDPAGLVLPVAEYDHSGPGCESVTGGYVSRRHVWSPMYGVYFYADYCNGKIWGLREVEGVWYTELLLDAAYRISSFGEDEAGNLYLADITNGRILRVAENLPDSDGDHMPDAFEEYYELNPESPDDAGEDADKDGPTNRDEFYAETNPRSAASALRIVSVSVTTGDLPRVEWASVPWKDYRVLGKTDVAAAWSPVADVRSVDGDTTVFVDDPIAADRKFYAVQTLP